MRIRVLSMLLVLALTTLSGCADDNTPTQDADEEKFKEFEDEPVSADKGLIRGIVVDPTITPIAEAKVVIKSLQLETTTNEDGAFQFSDLDPGPYFLDISKNGFKKVQSSATVEAGVSNPDIIRVQLDFGKLTEKTFSSQRYEGTLTCSVTVVLIAGNICDNPMLWIPVDSTPTYLQTEMHWKSNQALGGDMSLQYSWYCNSNGGFMCDHGSAGKSPVVIRMNNETILNDRFEGTPFGPDRDIAVRVFNEGLSETAGLLGVTIDQKFEHITHMFYNWEPSEDWVFSEDGDPVPPE